MERCQPCVILLYVAMVGSVLASPVRETRHGPNREERFQVRNLEFQSVGCWSDSVEKHTLVSLEGKHPLLMDGDGTNRANALMKCAEVAADLNLKVFGVQNGGECVGEPGGEHKYNRLGMSTLCHADGLGGPYANEVYRFLGSNVKAVDGMYTDWQEWGSCSATCGDGTMTRVRTCTDPAPAGGGKDCSHIGQSIESRKCSVARC